MSLGIAAIWAAFGIMLAAAVAVNARYSRRLRSAESAAALLAFRRTLLPEDGWFVGALVLGMVGMAAWTGDDGFARVFQIGCVVPLPALVMWAGLRLAWPGHYARYWHKLHREPHA